jgi:protein translocase SecG subunit
MLTVISILLIIIAVVLIGVVLLQPGKGDLTATFGGFSSQMGSMFGMQRTVTLLARITKILAIAIVVLTLVANKFFITHGGSEVETVKPVTEGTQIPAGPIGAPPTETPR